MLVFKVANVDHKCYSLAFFVGKKEMKVRHPSGSLGNQMFNVISMGFTHGY